MEEELRGRIDQLEKRQTQDDAVINVINRLVNKLKFRICHISHFFKIYSSEGSKSDVEFRDIIWFVKWFSKILES